MAWIDVVTTQAISTSHGLQKYLDGDGGGWDSFAGSTVNNETAMRISAVNSCVRILSEDKASLPGKVFERLDDGGRRPAPDHDLYPIVHRQANRLQTTMDWRATGMVHVLFGGNFLSFKSFTRRGRRLDELIPIEPHRVQKIELTEQRQIIYHIAREEGGTPERYTRDDIFHVPGLSSNGYSGRSVIADARETFGYARALQEFTSKIFKNRANYGVALKLPDGVKVGDDRYKNIRDSLKDAHEGSASKAWRTLLLEEGMDVKQTSMSLEDAQFVESYKLSIADIARIFKVPLHRLSELSKSSFNNIEQQSLEYVIYTLRPWLVRWEQAINSQLIEDSRYFVEFSVEGLLRGDMESQAKALAAEFQNGALTLNEWRALKNRNPYDSEIGDVPFIQMNLASPETLQPLNGSNSDTGAQVARFDEVQAKYDLAKAMHDDGRISDMEFCETCVSIRRRLGLPPKTLNGEAA